MVHHISASNSAASFIHTREPLPERVHNEAVRAFVNWVGCALGGANHEAVDRALEVSREFSGPPAAAVLGQAVRLDLINAAFLNCLSSSIRSFDDTHLPTITHPTGPVAAVLLALSERRTISGSEFVKALALGIEIECRLSNALLAPPAKAKLGWYVTGLTGGIAAALAGSRVLGLCHEKTVSALGIAASEASGFRQTHGSMAIGLVPAHAARCGLQAVLMADRGFVCTAGALEGRDGFFEVFGDPANPAALVDGLGERWEMLLNTYKPYPCGIVIHPAIDACLELKEKWRLDPSAIATVEVEVNPVCLALCDRPEPDDSYQAGVSLQHWVAASLARGKAGISEGSESCIRDPIVAGLRKLIRAKASESVGRDSAVVTITLADGRRVAGSVAHCRGSLAKPLTNDELSTKFRGQASVLIGFDGERLLEACWGVSELDDVAHIARLGVVARGTEVERTA